LVKSHGYGEQRTAWDLMIIDEAHRAKGDGSAFNEALRNLDDRAKRKLILTAMPEWRNRIRSSRHLSGPSQI
jgi:superfamily II DNA or RNA helicase